MSDQMLGFNDRIKKIKDPRNTFYVDPETGTFIPKRVSRKSIKKAAAKRIEKATFGGIMMCLVMGAAALVAARWVRWEYLAIEETASTADTLMMIDFGMAAMAVFLIGGVIGQKTFKHMLALTAGIAFALMTMHNLVWWMPDEMATVFGQGYVDQVRSLTEPSSIYLRGESIPVPLDGLA